LEVSDFGARAVCEVDSVLLIFEDGGEAQWIKAMFDHLGAQARADQLAAIPAAGTA
jgi:hypothetical protein